MNNQISLSTPLTTVLLPLSVIIVNKNAELKQLNIKQYTHEELYKKCGFKSTVGFKELVRWDGGDNLIISLFGKRKGMECNINTYEFPPPGESLIIHGNCVLIAHLINPITNNIEPHNLLINKWEHLYDKMHGGFENLDSTEIEDQNEPDELDLIPKSQKTREGYLKDGFVTEPKSRAVKADKIKIKPKERERTKKVPITPPIIINELVEESYSYK